MGVDNSDCLQKGVKDCGAYKLHSPPGKIGGNLVGKGRAGTAAVINGLTIPELEQILVKTAEFFLNLQKHLSVLNCGQNFPAVADDILILKQRIHVIRRVLRNGYGIETVKSLPEVFPFIQDTFPGQSCLKAFQKKHLKKIGIIQS